jgi:hypothetical protein
MNAPVKLEQLLLPGTKKFLEENGAIDQLSRDIGIDRQTHPLPKEIAGQTIRSLGQLFAGTAEEGMRLRTHGHHLGFPRVLDFLQRRNGEVFRKALRADFDQHHGAVRMGSVDKDSDAFQLGLIVESAELGEQLRAWYESIAAMIKANGRLLPAAQGLMTGPVDGSPSYRNDFEDGRFLQIDGFPPARDVVQSNPIWYRFGQGEDDIVSLTLGPAQELLAQKEFIEYSKKPDAPRLKTKSVLEYAAFYYGRIAEEYGRATVKGDLDS